MAQLKKFRLIIALFFYKDYGSDDNDSNKAGVL